MLFHDLVTYVKGEKAKREKGKNAARNSLLLTLLPFTPGILG
jgi:hypothetical protein